MTLDAEGNTAWGATVATTRMAGPPELMRLESAYLQQLQLIRGLRLRGDELTATGESGAALLRFTAEPE